jgi:hypothetical protein
LSLVNKSLQTLRFSQIHEWENGLTSSFRYVFPVLPQKDLGRRGKGTPIHRLCLWLIPLWLSSLDIHRSIWQLHIPISEASLNWVSLNWIFNLPLQKTQHLTFIWYSLFQRMALSILLYKPENYELLLITSLCLTFYIQHITWF